MGLFKRKSRATRRAEARAIKARAKLEAKLAAKNEARRAKAAQRAENKAAKSRIKAQRASDRSALKVAEAQLKTVQDGKFFSPTKIRRALTVARLLAPIAVPIVYRAAMATRGLLEERRAERYGLPLAEVAQFTGHGPRLSARIATAEKTLQSVRDKNPKDAETKRFASAIHERLADLSTAVTATHNMPSGRRRAAQTAISDQLDGIDADLMARLGVS